MLQRFDNEFERLRARRGSRDQDFDRIFPPWARRVSRRHFTPVAVAWRAAELLVDQPGKRVLDVGAGVGKFCLVGALATEGEFTGVEQRGHFVQLAQELARRYAVPRCRFIQANLTDLDWGEYDAFYLYNPFAEHLAGYQAIDHTIKLSPPHYTRYVRAVEERLERVAPGTRVVTYHGFGGSFPPGWRLHASERAGTDHLELWIKDSP